MRKLFAALLGIVLGLPAPAQQPVPPGGVSRLEAVGRVLDDWHDAAARADEPRYFSHFTRDAVFMGTDATERWTTQSFREWAKPYFERGKAWSFKAHDRFISFSTDARTAWFDELLDTPNLGTARGSGVIVFVGDGWKIAQYNLSVPVPNEILPDVVRQIRRFHGQADEPALPPGRSESTPGELRVISFNIRYATSEDGENAWENRREMVADLLREQNPDVVGLQEALRSQLDDLARDLPELGEIGVGRDDGKRAGEYAAILYRHDRFRVDDSGTFWLSSTPEQPGSRSWGNRVTRICTWARLVERGAEGEGPSRGGRGVYVFNVHLDHQSQRSRERSVELLIDRVFQREFEDPVIITGDFNAGEESAAIRYITGAAGRSDDNATPRFVDSFRVAHPSEREVGTYNGFRAERSGDKIDFIFVPPGTRVLDAAILRDSRDGRYPSDHFPVTAVLAWPLR